MSLVGVARELDRRSAPLARTAAFFALVALVMAGLWAIDSREILGINRWIKPLKFSLSLTIYLATLAWLLPHVTLGRRSRWIVTWVPVIMMVGEMVGIIGQSARGTTSHYNIATLFDAVVFQSMGIMIVINTLAVAVLAWAYWTQETTLPRAYREGIRWGLVVALIGMNEAWFMIGMQAHTVGLADGGPGLPLLNWSTRVGDLRVAHFVGMHALQLLPLAGWRTAREVTAAKGWPPDLGVRRVRVAAAAYALLVAGLFAWAMLERPLIDLG